MSVPPRIRTRAQTDANRAATRSQEAIAAGRPIEMEDVCPGLDEMEVGENGRTRLPQDPGDRIRFMEARFNSDSTAEYRRRMMYQYQRAGVPVAEICRRHNRSEHTIYRWLKDMREDMASKWKTMDVMDFHAQFMHDLETNMSMVYAGLTNASTPQAVASLTVAANGLRKLTLHHLEKAGMYRVLSVNGTGGADDSEEEAREMREQLSLAFESNEDLLPPDVDDQEDDEFDRWDNESPMEG